MCAPRKLYYLVQGKHFEYAIMAVIVANSALMATTYYGESDEMTSVVDAINYGFTGVYVLEFVLKVRGTGGHMCVVPVIGVCCVRESCARPLTSAVCVGECRITPRLAAVTQSTTNA